MLTSLAYAEGGVNESNLSLVRMSDVQETLPSGIIGIQQDPSELMLSSISEDTVPERIEEPPQNRTSCADIRGTVYYSDIERDWFLANCLTNYYPSTTYYQQLTAFNGNVSEIVCSPEFTWDCDWALAVVNCESSGNNNAIGSEYYQGRIVYFYGWFQVHNGPLDPYLNTVEAHIQYVQWQNGQRAKPWPNCPR